jgi:uncharacterized protein YacL
MRTNSNDFLNIAEMQNRKPVEKEVLEVKSIRIALIQIIILIITAVINAILMAKFNISENFNSYIADLLIIIGILMLIIDPIIAVISAIMIKSKGLWITNCW